MVPFCPNLRFCFARVDRLRLRAWSDDFNVVLFEFLEDDTKLAQSCTHCNAHDALGADGSRRELSRAHSLHIATFFPFFF